MATTMKLIAKNVLGSDTASVTFSSIPATYDDLLLVSSIRTAVTGATVDGIYVWFNSDTTSGNYTRRRLLGTGAAASSDTGQQLVLVPTSIATSNTFSNDEIYIPNYGGSTNKSWSVASVAEHNASTAYIAAGAGLWSNTAAITSIQLISQNSVNLLSGSSFFLYGIKKA